MHTKETTPLAATASSVSLDTAGREQIKALATSAAQTIDGDCQHCNGTGRSSETAQQIVHCFGPSWFGVNWELTRLHAAIDSADHIRWANDITGHDLVVILDGEAYQFQVQRPAQAEAAA